MERGNGLSGCLSPKLIPMNLKSGSKSTGVLRWRQATKHSLVSCQNRSGNCDNTGLALSELACLLNSRPSHKLRSLGASSRSLGRPCCIQEGQPKAIGLSTRPMKNTSPASRNRRRLDQATRIGHSRPPAPRRTGFLLFFCHRPPHAFNGLEACL